MTNIVVCTAGHVDHGKTEMVRILTGIQTDRLKEEKERQISIDIGFAYLTLPSGKSLDIIDVPGHEKFVRNMLRGAFCVDLAILVVAADDGPMPQTREHLEILELLGVKRGIIVISKVDLADNDLLKLVKEDILKLTQGTFLGEAPIINFSAMKKEGKANIISALSRLTTDIKKPRTGSAARLTIDRVFTLSGFGTVVTGTLLSGKLQKGDSVVIYPAGIKTKVRSIQVHNRKVQEVFAGQRIGINLQKVEVDQVEKGMVVGKPNTLSVSHFINARIRILESCKSPLNNKDRVMFYTGTSEIVGRVILMNNEQIKPGESGLVQFRLEKSISPAIYDRLIIRRLSPKITIGGGMILEITSKKYREKDRELLNDLECIERRDDRDIIMMLFRRWSYHKSPCVRKLSLLSGLDENTVTDVLNKLREQNLIVEHNGRMLTHTYEYERLKDNIINHLRVSYRQNPLEVSIPTESLKKKISSTLDGDLFNLALIDLENQKRINVTNYGVRLSGQKPMLNRGQAHLCETVMAMFERSVTLIWPSQIEELITEYKPSEVKSVLKFLANEKQIVVLKDGAVIRRKELDNIKTGIRQHFSDKSGFSLADFKEIAGIGRRPAVNILEHLDSIGFTVRQGEKRVLL